jgi:predicted transcriptional regulator
LHCGAAGADLCQDLVMSKPPSEFQEEPAVFVLEEAVDLTAADRRAMADIEAGRFISHDAVMRWVASWGTDDELPPPECGE